MTSPDDKISPELIERNAAERRLKRSLRRMNQIVRMFGQLDMASRTWVISRLYSDSRKTK